MDTSVPGRGGGREDGVGWREVPTDRPSCRRCPFSCTGLDENFMIKLFAPTTSLAFCTSYLICFSEQSYRYYHCMLNCKPRGVGSPSVYDAPKAITGRSRKVIPARPSNSHMRFRTQHLNSGVNEVKPTLLVFS